MAANLVPQPNTHLASRQGFILPGAIARAGRKAQEGFLEFFFASIRNTNTREAYARAVRDFSSGVSGASTIPQQGHEYSPPVFVREAVLI